jgi:MFS superfamily sulfate permease-like transporter
VLFDFASVDFMDITGGDELLRLVRELQKRDVSVAFAHVRDPIREDMRLAGIETAVGPDNFYERTTDGVRAWLKQAGDTACAPGRTAGASHEAG